MPPDPQKGAIPCEGTDFRALPDIVKLGQGLGRRQGRGQARCALLLALLYALLLAQLLALLLPSG